MDSEFASFHTSYFEQVWDGKEEMIHYEMDMKGVHLMFLLRPIHRDGRIAGLLLVGVDNSVQRHMEERIVYLEDHDLLTQLPNRAALTPYLDGMIQEGGWESAVVLALDIDQFQMVNESLGNQVGDRILQLLARRLKQGEFMLHGGYAARIDGNAFVCVIPGRPQQGRGSIGHDDGVAEASVPASWT